MRRRSIAGWAKIYFIFPPYRFTHPKTDESVVVRRWSYLWAGLFGAIYVAWKGMGSRFLLALLVNIGFLLAAVAVAGVTSLPFVPKRQQAIALLAMVPIIIGVQGTMMIRLIRDGYRRRGWKVRKDD